MVAARLAAAAVVSLGACADDATMADGTSDTGTEDTGSTSVFNPTSGGSVGDPDTGTTAEVDTTASVDTTTEGDETTGGMVDPHPVPGETIVCTNDIAPAPAGEVCTVTPGAGTMLLQGTVLAGWDIYEAGTVLIDTTTANGRVLCAGCDCGDEIEAEGATVVACPDGVISPGLVNPHDHITFTLSQPVPHDTERYDHRHEWRLGLDGATELDTFPGSNSSREGVLYGEVRNLLAGGTSLTGSVGGASAQGLVRNLDRADLTGGLSGVDVNYRTFPLGDSGGQLQAAGCGYPSIDGDFNLFDDIYLPHIAEGITIQARNEFVCMNGARGGENLIAPNTSVIHGIGLLAGDVDDMGALGSMLVWSPRSNVDLYGITADVPMFRNLGVRIALGTDWSASGSMNMLRELSCADSLNQAHYDGALDDVELFMMATHWAAASQGAEDQLGLIRPGHVADLAVFDGSTNADYRAIIDGEPSTVSLVLRGGQPLHGDAAIIEALVPAEEIDGCEALDVCGTDKRICAERDSGLTLAAIQSAVNDESYPFFFCGTPDDEPSCDPARPDEFPERGGPDDADGDGVADAEDNCPAIFNPIRPMDGGQQADADDDGIGNSCDLCPLEAGQSCTVPNVYDLDGDEIIDPSDNCIAAGNPNQADEDADGQGDACDICPSLANPGGGPCPASIYEIKDGTIPEGTDVFIEDALVTGVGATGYFLQVPEDDPGYEGVEFSGVFVFDNGNFAQPVAGDLVEVGGTVQDFFGQLQLVSSTPPTILSSGNPPPTPEPAAVADIIEGGALQMELEAVLVEVSNVAVTDVMPMGGPGDGGAEGEFEVDGTLRVNDYFYLATPFPVPDQTFSRITGVARWANQFTKLEPRGLADYPASLQSFGQPESFLLNGTTAEPLPGLSAVLSAVVAVDTPVMLTYQDDMIVSGPPSVTVPMGSSSVVVSLTGESVGTANVTATLDGNAIAPAVRVYDDTEPRVPTLSPDAVNIPLGGMTTMTVSLDLPAPLVTGQDVDLTLAPETCASTPALVNVPAQAMSVDFDVTALACVGVETLTADIGGITDDATISVVDAPVFATPVIAEVYYDHTSNDDQFEWVKIYNGTGGALDLSNYSLGWGGTDYTWGTLDLVGMLPDGECFVVGGPMGDATSGFPGGPMFDQAVDLEQDIQNGAGAGTADGVALFDIAATSIETASVPLDAVIYGGVNDNGLLGPTGAVAAVDVADAPSESSIVRQADDTWGINATPTPLACTPFPEP
ncbi:MAG: amidohydrolase family protein [Myxococcota bacterium]